MLKIEEWPKVMEKDENYYIFCHKQVNRENLNVNEKKLMAPRTVIRRDLSMPIVMSTFRTNAL